VTINIDQAIQSLRCAETTAYIGEAVSQLEHALQAAYFAEQSGHSEEVILACLFHDIGHYATQTQQHTMADLGIVNHEWLGARLAYDMGFSAHVALLIGYHVEAKRYLSAKKPLYYERLSEASKGTLAFQGGPMSDEEVQQFETLSIYKEILQVRVNDEKAKVVDLEVPGLEYYRPMMMNHVKKNNNRKLSERCELKDFINRDWVEELKYLLFQGITR
jgi:putative nucleotidyltransferase with HDIG domain